jgi:hypothetical protein
MTDKLTADEFEEASKGWKLPEKHDDADEVSFYTVETDDPQALDDFLRLFAGQPKEPGERPESNSFLIKDDDGFVKTDGKFVIYTKTNGPYIYMMVNGHDLGGNITPLEVKNG